MYLLIGEQPIEPMEPEQRSEQFAHMADVLRQSAGFRGGYWGPDEDDATIAHAVVHFDTRDNALAFRTAVEHAVPDVRLRVMEVSVSEPAR